MNFAVLGLYNSGSSALAGMLHRMGANLGAPFAREPGSTAPTRHYESSDLARALRTWWNEPDIEEKTPRYARLVWLTDWARRHEDAGSAPLGAKHPLLALCAGDVALAWGTDTRFIWSHRPLEESVAGLQRRGWFAGREAPLQEQLWAALQAFEDSHGGVVRVPWARVRAEPEAAARELAALIGLDPTAEQLRAAADFVTDPRAA